MTVDDPAALAAAFAQGARDGHDRAIDVKADKDCPTPVYDFTAGARAWSYHENIARCVIKWRRYWGFWLVLRTCVVLTVVPSC